MLAMILQAATDVSGPATSVGVTLLLALKIGEKISTYSNRLNSKSGDKPPEYWLRAFDAAVNKGNERQIELLESIKDDMHELVILLREK